MPGYTKEQSTRDAAPAKKGKGGLSVHRRKMKRVLFERSNGFCEICQWQVATDLHHVFGRGKNNRDWREQPDALLNVCRLCHRPGYVHDRTGESVEELSLAAVLSGDRHIWDGLTLNG